MELLRVMMGYNFLIEECFVIYFMPFLESLLVQEFFFKKK